MQTVGYSILTVTSKSTHVILAMLAKRECGTTVSTVRCLYRSAQTGVCVVIRVLLAHHGELIRGALAAVLAAAPNIEVVAESSHGDAVVDCAKRERPHIAVLDFDLPVATSMAALCGELSALCAVLIIADRQSAAGIKVDFGRLAPRVGLIAKESPPGALIEGVRRLVAGETVLDGELVRAALVAGRNPLSDRECEVLRLAGLGMTTKDIAKKLFLSHGTVRNHLSRVLAKTGGRTRIEALRIAQESGWI